MCRTAPDKGLFCGVRATRVCRRARGLRRGILISGITVGPWQGSVCASPRAVPRSSRWAQATLQLLHPAVWRCCEAGGPDPAAPNGARSLAGRGRGFFLARDVPLCSLLQGTWYSSTGSRWSRPSCRVHGTPTARCGPAASPTWASSASASAFSWAPSSRRYRLHPSPAGPFPRSLPGQRGAIAR